MTTYDRRRLLKLSGLTAAAIALVPPRIALAEWLAATPAQPAGPFYHPFEPLSVDNDLLFREGRTQPAEGDIIYVEGRVRDQTGRPVAGARVEIWQANNYGRYNHPRHANSDLRLDPNFLGFGHTLTDKAGAYRFRTIKPAPYPDSASWLRPPHIHFAIFPKGGAEWTTQMYFAGEELNRGDFLLRGLPSDADRARVTVDLREAPGAPDKGARLGRFDIVLGMPGVTRDKA